MFRAIHPMEFQIHPMEIPIHGHFLGEIWDRFLPYSGENVLSGLPFAFPFHLTISLSNIPHFHSFAPDGSFGRKNRALRVKKQSRQRCATPFQGSKGPSATSAPYPQFAPAPGHAALATGRDEEQLREVVTEK